MSAWRPARPVLELEPELRSAWRPVRPAGMLGVVPAAWRALLVGMVALGSCRAFNHV